MTVSGGLPVLFACAAIALAAASGWVMTALAAGWLIDARRVPTALRVALLANLRLWPGTCAALLVCAQVVAFARHETERAESAGPLLVVLAACGVGLLAHAIWSAARVWLRTARIVRMWRRGAAPLVVHGWPRPAWIVEPESPVVAVAGVLRPELYVAREVAARCTPTELAAIAAHEAAHVEGRDNLTRLLFALTPGVILFRQSAARLEAAWSAAAEELADARAGRQGVSLDLAAALVKVARLMRPGGAQTVPAVASGLIAGADLDSRVRRLLGAPVEVSGSGTWLPALAMLLLLLALLTWPVSLALHEGFELLVRHY